MPNLQALNVNVLRTYLSWYWEKKDDLAYLAAIDKNTPMTTFADAKQPYTVSFDHAPFLDACHAAGIHVLLGIAIEGGKCFNFDDPDVSWPYQNFYLQTAQKLATLYGQHPAVMGFCMGNEQNNAVVNVDSRAWLFYQQMYQAIKAEAADKLVTIAFQDDPNHGLYNGSVTVKDQANQYPPTAFANLPVEQAVSMVVDVWGINIYAGIETDFPFFEANVVTAANGAYARPLWVTEWGTPAGKNSGGMPGPVDGNAVGEELSEKELRAGAGTISNAMTIIGQYLYFVAGAFYFSYTDEWWKNTSFNLISTHLQPSRSL